MMSRRFILIMTFLGLSIFLSIYPINAQILQDTIAMKLVREDIDYIYNFQFNNADEVYTKIIKLYPEHPIIFLLKGINSYWKNYPMLRSTPCHESFEENMKQCIRLSESNTNPDYEAEYLLADLCASGMLLMYYDDNDLIMQVIPLTKSTYINLRHSYKFITVCPDLNYFTGLYDYYREAYPKAFPIYKSLLLPFPAGGTAKGLEELNTAATKSVVLRPESCSLLSSIYLNFENKYPESIYYCKTLYDRYPGNAYYLMYYIKELLLMEQYDEAEKLMTSYEIEGNNYFNAQLMILKGILQEKKYHENKLAQQYFNEGINEISLFGKYGNEFAGYAYFGLSRVSDSNNGKKINNIYRKEALRLSTFKKINFDN